MPAPKFTNELACKFLDLIANDNADIAEAARACGFGAKLAFAWVNKAMKAKAAGDETSIYRVKNWLRVPEDTEDQWMHFSDALAAARKMNVLSIESIQRRLISGRERPVLDKSGNQVWLVDAALIAQWNGDREAALAAGVFDPFYQHDPITSERLPMKVIDDPPAAFRVAALKALMPAIWNVPEHRVTETTVTTVSATANEAIKQIEHVRPAQKIREQTPMVEEMERLLHELRQKGPKNPVPQGAPPQKFTPNDGHQRDDQNNKPPDPPNPRAYRLPDPQPPAPNRGGRHPAPPPGGMKIV